MSARLCRQSDHQKLEGGGKFYCVYEEGSETRLTSVCFRTRSYKVVMFKVTAVRGKTKGGALYLAQAAEFAWVWTRVFDHLGAGTALKLGKKKK